MNHYKTIIMSDLHLGARQSQTDKIIEFLNNNKADKLILNGDIIDGWALKSGGKWKKDHTKIFRKFMKMSEKGCEVIYIRGNHDDFLRSYGLLDLGNITIVDEIVEKDCWIVHGDKYDGVIMYSKWVAVMGSFGYEVVIFFSEMIKKIRRSLGLRPRSLSKWVKAKVKGAVSFIVSFEKTLSREAKIRGCTTVICGHIHTPSDKSVEGVRYINTGDWVESCSYVVLDKGVLTLHH